MSLINKKKKSEDRSELTTEAAVRDKVEAEQAEKRKAIQKKHRDRYLADWKHEKSVIDDLSGSELSEYVNGHEGNAIDPRVGLHSMKINPYELAVVKQAMEIVGARSSRELFVNHCKEVIKNSK
ncbi:hypothetical protein [Vibrio jasicida]|uniref:hypothetical protein n=1 Tax=Vibrio jasicida TaxID=766224 RepID=UPI000CE52AC6|nr:hypothetical protein [Vibrio jasicida]